jgi:hypothetical protein
MVGIDICVIGRLLGPATGADDNADCLALTCGRLSGCNKDLTRVWKGDVVGNAPGILGVLMAQEARSDRMNCGSTDCRRRLASLPR